MLLKSLDVKTEYLKMILIEITNFTHPEHFTNYLKNKHKIWRSHSIDTRLVLTKEQFKIFNSSQLKSCCQGKESTVVQLMWYYIFFSIIKEGKRENANHQHFLLSHNIF